MDGLDATEVPLKPRGSIMGTLVRRSFTGPGAGTMTARTARLSSCRGWRLSKQGIDLVGSANPEGGSGGLSELLP